MRAIFANFTSGELTPRLTGRVDLAKYDTGLEELRNAYPFPHGGINKRPGFKFARESLGRNQVTNGTFDADTDWTKGTGWSIAAGVASCDGTQTADSHLEQDVNLVAERTYEVRFTVSAFSAGSVLVTAGDDSSVAVGANGDYDVRLTPTSGTDLYITADSDFIGSIDNIEVREVNPVTRLIPFQFSTEQAYILAFTEKNIRVFRNGGIVVDGDDPVEIETPFLEDELFDITYTQSADVLYFAHTNHSPPKLSRTSHTSWTFSTISFSSPPAAWTTSDYPAVVTLHEERLTYGGSPSNPQTWWMSKTSDYEDFGVSSPLVDSDSCTYTISSDQVQTIRWMVSGRYLMVGTQAGAWKVSGGSSNTITPTTVKVEREASVGSKVQNPIPVESVILFLQRDSRRIHELSYSFEADGYVAPDISILSEHLSRSTTYLNWAFASSPDSLVWIVRSDGSLVSLTYLKDQKVLGFAQHDTDGLFKSVATIPSEDESYDELWVAVEREIDGEKRAYVEQAQPQFTADDTRTAFFVDSGISYNEPISITGITRANPAVVTAPAHGLSNGDTVYLNDIVGMTELNFGTFTVANVTTNTFELDSTDSSAYTAYREEGSAYKYVSTFTGLSHLEGKEVQILADGAVRANKTVASGTVTLDAPAAIVHMGLAYTMRMKTLRLDLDTRDGTIQAVIKRIPDLAIRLYRTLGLKYGWYNKTTDALEMQTLPFRSSAMPLGQPPDLFTGDKECKFPQGWNKDGQIVIEHNQPLPATILALIMKVDVSDG